MNSAQVKTGFTTVIDVTKLYIEVYEGDVRLFPVELRAAGVDAVYPLIDGDKVVLEVISKEGNLHTRKERTEPAAGEDWDKGQVVLSFDDYDSNSNGTYTWRFFVVRGAQVISLCAGLFEVKPGSRPNARLIRGKIKVKATLKGALSVDAVSTGTIEAEATLKGIFYVNHEFIRGRISANATVTGDITAQRVVSGKIIVHPILTGELKC